MLALLMAELQTGLTVEPERQAGVLAVMDAAVRPPPERRYAAATAALPTGAAEPELATAAIRLRAAPGALRPAGRTT